MIGREGEKRADLPECASTVRRTERSPAAVESAREVLAAVLGETVMVRTSSALMVRSRRPCPIRFESGTSTRTTRPIGSRRVKLVRGKRARQVMGSEAVTDAGRTGRRAEGGAVRTRWTGAERERGPAWAEGSG